MPHFDQQLIERYDQAGPRYTSYPPATEFHSDISDLDFRSWAKRSNENPIPRPLSLYFHIPFCSSICYYCACNKIITKDHSKADAYLEDLFHEIELRSELFDVDRLVQQLHWGGGTPGFLSHDQMQALMDKTRQHFKLRSDDGGDYSIELDPRVIKEQGIAHLRKLGFNRLSLGVQDFNPEVQRAINRIQSIEQTRDAIEHARDLGFKSVNIDLIYGLPMQTSESFKNTLDTIIELDPDRIAMYNYAHLLHRFPPQRRINADELPSPDMRLAILGNGIEQLINAGYQYIGMDHFAKHNDELSIAQREGSLHRNFQGYAAHAQCDSIGFGVSAISQIEDHFAQNVLDLKNYHNSISEDQLPIARGYQSTWEDLLRREVIQRLICHFVLDVKEVEQQWGINFRQYFANELAALESMQKDGLLEVSADHINVLEPGRLLIRNICMVFDEYGKAAGETPRFSRVL